MDDLVGGWRWNMNASAEIGNQQKFRYLVVGSFERHNEAGNADLLCRSSKVRWEHLFQASRSCLQHFLSTRVGVFHLAYVEFLEILHGIPILWHQRHPSH